MRKGIMNHSTEDLLARLKQIFLFRPWPAQDLAALAPRVRFLQKRKDDLLFLQSEPCQWLYVLARGEVQMFVQNEDGREITLHVLHPGALVACAALFLGKAYPASARVISAEAELVAIEGEAFLKMLAERPDLSQKMIAALASRIGELAARLESHTSESAEQRVAEWLLDQPSSLRADGGREIHLKGTKKAAAAELGMTPETFSRSLKKLFDLGAIQVSGKSIWLVDVGVLEEVVGE